METSGRVGWNQLGDRGSTGEVRVRCEGGEEEGGGAELRGTWRGERMKGRRRREQSKGAGGARKKQSVKGKR